MKLNDKADAAVLAELQTYVARIGKELAEPLVYHLSPNRAAGGSDYNWVLHSTFATEGDMNGYRDAPLHIEFAEFCDPYTDDFLVTYYDAPST
jgi:hypothetical protein